ncbi:hypothetical protein AQUCO_00900290v1 [Aquilegia coerulea]|uniref:Uncharacterized protein n=1 Tax=Aquilegia coerulea TaxID=218851 RepID=A0A2G5ECX3_AQUCA|nr:hypothetical protein AQUCO_00900290v1 [Aquilegia coerulea]
MCHPLTPIVPLIKSLQPPVSLIFACIVIVNTMISCRILCYHLSSLLGMLIVRIKILINFPDCVNLPTPPHVAICYLGQVYG